MSNPNPYTVVAEISPQNFPRVAATLELLVEAIVSESASYVRGHNMPQPVVHVIAAAVLMQMQHQLSLLEQRARTRIPENVTADEMWIDENGERQPMPMKSTAGKS